METISFERTNDLRKDILGVAERMFQDYGYDETTFQNIADTLGITKGAITYHFKNKHFIMGELIQSSFGGIRDYIDAYPAYYRNAYWRYSVMYIYAYRIILTNPHNESLFYHKHQVEQWENMMVDTVRNIYGAITRDFHKTFTDEELLMAALMDLGARWRLHEAYTKTPELFTVDKFCYYHVYLLGCLSRLDEATIRENIEYAFEFTRTFPAPVIPLFC